MNLEQFKEYAKRNIKEPSFLPKAKDKKSYVCPVCGNGSGRTGIGINAHQKDNGEFEYKCFSDGNPAYDIINLWQHHTKNFDFKESLKSLAMFYGITIDEPLPNTNVSGTTFPFSQGQRQPVITSNLPSRPLEPKEEKEQPKIDQTEYINKCAKDLYKLLKNGKYRGIAAKTLEGYNIGYDSKYNQLVIPYDNYYTNKRNLSAEQITKYGKYHKVGTQPNYFNDSILKKNINYVFVCEGEMDCLSLLDLGFNAIALGSTNARANNMSSEQYLINVIQENPNLKIFICFDNDKTGMNATIKLTEKLKHYGTATDSTFFLFQGKQYKDVNEFLIKDNELLESRLKEFLSLHFDNLVEKYSDQVSASNLLNEMKTNDFKPIKTGFSNLDSALGGGFHNGLIALSGAPATGKTAFVQHLLSNISQTQDELVVIFSLEMSKADLMKRDIIRTQITSYKQKPRFRINDLFTLKNKSQQEQAYIAQLIGTLYGREKHQQKLIIDSTSSDNDFNITIEFIEETVKAIQKETHKNPIVCVDYLQIIAPSPGYKDIRQSTDHIVKGLKRIANKTKKPVIAISSTSRTNYNNKTDIADFKESGCIEFTADMCLSLQFTSIEESKKDVDIDSEKKEELRHLTLKCTKNRHGRTFSTKFKFYAPAFYFE